MASALAKSCGSGRSGSDSGSPTMVIQHLQTRIIIQFYLDCCLTHLLRFQVTEKNAMFYFEIEDPHPSEGAG